MGFRGWFSRQTPTAGVIEEIVARIIHDPGSGRGAFTGATASAGKAEQFAIDGGQTQFVKMAHQATAAGVYPGGGTLGASPATAGGTTITLPSGAPAANINPVGMIYLHRAGVGLGEYRTIIGWNSGTRAATVERAWTAGRVPANGEAFDLLMDARPNSVLMKTEYSVGTNSITGALLLYDFPLTLDQPTPVARDSIVLHDSSLTIRNKNRTTRVTEAGYYAGLGLVVDARGFLGWQFDVESVSAGAFSLWGASK